MNATSNITSNILIAEDDEGHATLIQRHFKRAGFESKTVRLKDGQELLDYVQRRGPWSSRQPHEAVAIIVDLNMPRLNGFEVLQVLKSDDAWCRIPVFVLTTTDNPHEVDRCYELGAAAYFVKPLDYGVFGEMIRHFADFLRTAQLPSELPVAVDGR
jgi:CheY-like chemotaxis protein